MNHELHDLWALWDFCERNANNLLVNLFSGILYSTE